MNHMEMDDMDHFLVLANKLQNEEGEKTEKSKWIVQRNTNYKHIKSNDVLQLSGIGWQPINAFPVKPGAQ